MEIKEIPVQILNLKDDEILILRLPKEAFQPIPNFGGFTGAYSLEKEFEHMFKRLDKRCIVKALPQTVELAVIKADL